MFKCRFDLRANASSMLNRQELTLVRLKGKIPLPKEQNYRHYLQSRHRCF